MKKFLSVLLACALCFTSAVSLIGCQTSCSHADADNNGYCDSCTEKVGNWYTVTFKNGTETVSTVSVFKGKKVSAPTTAPTAPAGKVFDGWKDNAGAAWDFNSPITSNVTLNASFVDEVLNTYTVYFYDDNDEDIMPSVQVAENGLVTDPGNPTKSATMDKIYEFVGWFDENGEEWNFATNTVTGDTYLYATFNEIEDTTTPRYTVTFNNYDGSLIDTKIVIKNSKVSVTAEPATRQATNNVVYIFDKWVDENGQVFDFAERLVDENITLTASYRMEYRGQVNVTLYYHAVENDATVDKVVNYSIDAGQTLNTFLESSNQQLPFPAKADSQSTIYEFAGWKTASGEVWSFSEGIISENLSLYAHYEEYSKSASGESVKIRLGGYITHPTQRTAYQAMIAEFNKLYGTLRAQSTDEDGNKKKGIIATFAPQSSWADYESAAQTQLSKDANDPFHVYMVNDRNFKTWAQKYSDMIVNIGAVDGKFTKDPTFNDQLDGMWTGMINRFRLNTNGWTSYENDDLWAVPVDSNPTALYYNRTVLENNGIIVISVEDITLDEATYQDLAERAAKMESLHYEGGVVTEDGTGYDGEPVGYYNGLQRLKQTECVGRRLIDLWNEGHIEDMFGNNHDQLLFTEGKYDEAEGKHYIMDYYNERAIYEDFLATYDITVPAKGFYRSVSPRDARQGSYTITPPMPCGDEMTGYYTEPLIFNASIAMSWDEMEDIALLCTKTEKHNLDSASTYGFYTQWWFAYGWSVGGDCVEDMTGDGAWAFSLSDYTTNYMVTENACTEPSALDQSVLVYKGVWTGTEYHPGDILSFLDKMNVTKLTIAGEDATGGTVVVPAEDGGFLAYDVNGNMKRLGREYQAVLAAGDVNDDQGIRPEIRESSSKNQNDENIKFVELPSTREAFARFCHLCPGADEESLSVSPKPTNSTNEADDINLLGKGEVAFMIERGDKLGAIRNATAGNGHSWGVANVPVFKEYVTEEGWIDPNDDAVQRMGILTGHSECVALGISAGCPVDLQDEAWEFIQWMSADYFYRSAETGDLYFGNRKSEDDEVFKAGQTVKANNGFIPNQQGLFEAQENSQDTFIKVGEENLNLHLFAYAIEYESAGDWWYLPNGASTWISNWASPLNSATGVRGGTMSLASWYNSIIKSTNNILHSSFNYYYKTDSKVEQQWAKEFGAR